MSEPAQNYYAASAPEHALATPLQGDAKADICVIGGGFTGLSAALCAAQAGARVILLEQASLGYGASGRNGGQIHPGHRKTQAELERWLGEQHARDLWHLSEEARALVFELAGTDCDLKRGLVVAAHNAQSAQDLAEDAEHLCTRYGYDQRAMLDAPKSAALLGTSRYQATRLDRGGGHLHPLKFVQSLAARAAQAGAALHDRSDARMIEGNTVHCGRGRVTADRIVLATDALGAALAPRLAPFIAHVESFILATAPLGALGGGVLPSDVAVADTRHVLDYYRKSADGRLLFAGREAYWDVPRDIARLVRPRMLRVFPQLKDIPITHAWSGTVGITRTRMPHFGRLSENVLFGHGYSGHGVALSVLGGKALAEAALGDPERFDVLARVPARPFPGGPLLRKPMVTAALTLLKLRDAF